mmetsp:Transcript_7876/g.17355  ORF Transcript_7876/g.17355 Transcript_7876/m.17355 type:complete len:245 (+) Transcript_7876:781-1515(+)
MIEPFAPPRSPNSVLFLSYVPASCHASRKKMGLQLTLSTNFQRSSRKAFSWPIWSMPSPFVFPFSLSSTVPKATASLSGSAASGYPSTFTSWSMYFSCRALARSSMSSNGKGSALQAPTCTPILLRVCDSNFGCGPVMMQLPQPVPAFVHFLMASKVWAPSWMALRMTFLGTLWQLQTWSSSPKPVPSPPSSTFGYLPSISSSGNMPPKSGRLLTEVSFVKALMSPTRMPPKSLLPSGVKTSFL